MFTNMASQCLTMLTVTGGRICVSVSFLAFILLYGGIFVVKMKTSDESCKMTPVMCHMLYKKNIYEK